MNREENNFRPMPPTGSYVTPPQGTHSSNSSSSTNISHRGGSQSSEVVAASQANFSLPPPPYQARAPTESPHSLFMHSHSSTPHLPPTHPNIQVYGDPLPLISAVAPPPAHHHSHLHPHHNSSPLQPGVSSEPSVALPQHPASSEPARVPPVHVVTHASSVPEQPPSYAAVASQSITSHTHQPNHPQLVPDLQPSHQPHHLNPANFQQQQQIPPPPHIPAQVAVASSSAVQPPPSSIPYPNPNLLTQNIPAPEESLWDGPAAFYTCRFVFIVSALAGAGLSHSLTALRTYTDAERADLSSLVLVLNDIAVEAFAASAQILATARETTVLNPSQMHAFSSTLKRWNLVSRQGLPFLTYLDNYEWMPHLPLPQTHLSRMHFGHLYSHQRP